MQHVTIYQGGSGGGAGCFEIICILGSLWIAVVVFVWLFWPLAVLLCVLLIWATLYFGWRTCRWCYRLCTYRSVAVANMATIVADLRVVDKRSLKIELQMTKCKTIAGGLDTKDQTIVQEKIDKLKGQLEKVRGEAHANYGVRATEIKKKVLLRIGDIKLTRYQRLVTQINEQLQEVDRMLERIDRRLSEC